jgi:hypothetical protein
MKMTMNVQLKPQEFDVDAARKALRVAISVKLACSRDIDQITIVIHESEARVAKLREGLGEFTTLLDQIAEAASDALKNDAPLVTPAGLAESKQRHAKLLEDISFGEAGIASLRAKREQYVRDLGVHTTRVNEAVAPIINDVGEFLAGDCLALEHEAALAREKARAFIQSSANKKLGPLAFKVMSNSAENASAPMLNTSNWHRCQRWKRDFKEWRAALEVDANAKLDLSGDEKE